MRILFLAPQPFFQERGTPIAVRLALEVLCQRKLEVDLITYGEGEDISIPHVTLYRSPSCRLLTGVRPGISVKKLICDFIFSLYVFWHILKVGPSKFQLVHAVEEAVFIAWLIRVLFGIPYIYDMDSSLTLQLTDKWWLLKVFRPLLKFLESLAIRGSLSVAPVCDALAVVANAQGAKSTFILRDTPLLHGARRPPRTLRHEVSLPSDALLCLYVGNLERYQGIDLLIESFGLLISRVPKAHLLVVGGNEKDVSNYRKLVAERNWSKKIHFLGSRPIAYLSAYIGEADIVVSPRILGNNTPMKIYSYLHSGKPVVATRIESHTQVLDDSIAMLVDAVPSEFSRALEQLLSNPDMCRTLGERAAERAKALYSFEEFSKQLNALYNSADEEIQQRKTAKLLFSPPP
jgi:glycosyltransferase involved in cell wall biosynthesis